MKGQILVFVLLCLRACETAVRPAPRPNLSWAPSFNLLGARWGGCSRDPIGPHDLRDDMQHAQVAFSTLLEIAAERESVGAFSEDLIEVRAIDRGGVEVPEEITLDSIKEMVRLLYYERQRLSRKALESILTRVSSDSSLPMLPLPNTPR